MKAAIEDREALEALSWMDLKAYADIHKWNRVGTYAGKAAIYTTVDQNGREAEILVPLGHQFADYASTMARALSTISEVEGRSQIAIYTDLVGVGVDTVRLRAPEADAQGTIALGHGVAMYREAENLMLAAACAAHSPRPSYHARKIAEVRDYLDTVRLGQTERGSYVITVQSPIAPALAKPLQPPLASDWETEPFPRLVTLTLAKALASATDAIRTAIDTDRFDAFDAAVQQGVNANLCEALARLAECGGGIDVALSWARVRPAPVPPPVFRFSRDMGRVLQSAAQEFRKNEPLFDEAIQGFVIHLDRSPEQTTGTATLRTLVGGRPKRLRATFDAAEYSQVVRAHDDRLPISLEGDIYPFGQRWELRNPRNLRLLTEPQETEDPQPWE
jgi:hypothetical protein